MNPRPSNLALAPVAGALLALATSAAAGPVLELAPVPGPGLTIAVRVRDIGPVPAAGWQAFLEFDPSRLTLVSGSYITTRFGLPLLSPIAAQAGHIDLAAGINAFTGQSPTADDQDLALLQFVPTGTG
ncbi:MAG TPA: hypothetical protein PKE29_15690, partial [Phycisphaerales bacterium]|nr:hypothetical protein [Phycisphaerales bacterium]